MMENNIIIEAVNIIKNYNIGNNKTKILKRLNFKVERGDFLSIMGPSGCGKSTLLYILGGLDKPTEGSVIIDGNDLSKLSEKELCLMRRRKIGFMFQFYNLVQNLTVEDNIMLPLILDGKKKSDYQKKLDDLLEIIGLQDKKKMTPRELSGGQQQRAAIARALIFEPDILFLDEPIGNLDSKTGIEIMKLFRVINTTMNKTIIQVTHSKESAMFGTKLLNIKDGRIVGKIEQLDSLRSQIDNNSQESNKTGVKKVKRRRM